MYATHREGKLMEHLCSEQNETKKQTGVPKELSLAERLGVRDMINKSVSDMAEKARDRQDYGFVGKKGSSG